MPLVPKTHVILTDAIEDGLASALRNEVPDDILEIINAYPDSGEFAELLERFHNRVMNSIYEKFTVEGEGY